MHMDLDFPNIIWLWESFFSFKPEAPLQPHSIPNFQRFQCYLDILQTCIHHLQIFYHTFTLQQSSEYWMPSIHILLQNVHVIFVNLQTLIHLHFQCMQNIWYYPHNKMLVELSQIYGCPFHSFAFSPSQMNYLTLLNICVMQNLAGTSQCSSTPSSPGFSACIH